VDTVTVKQKLTFDQISEALNIPKDEIEYLNPTYKDEVIPAFADDVYSLRLQKKYIGDFMTNETALYAYKTKAMLEEEKILAEKQKEIHRKDSLLAIKQYVYKKSTTTTVTTNDAKTTTGSDATYTVKAGDGLGLIASVYGCTITQLQAWNKLATLNIFPGQKLYVHDPATIAAKSDSNAAKTDVKATTTTTTQTTTVATQSAKTAKYVYHTVQKGDTLWGIANQYKGVTVEEIKSLNNLTNASMLYVGQKLKVAVTS
jgi:membrane-bound lytic murein transglycosylase D